MYNTIFKNHRDAIPEIASTAYTVKRGGSKPKNVGILAFGGPGAGLQAIALGSILRCLRGGHTCILFEKGLATVCQADYEKKGWKQPEEVPQVRVVKPDDLDDTHLKVRSSKGKRSFLLEDLLDPRNVAPFLRCGRDGGIGKSNKMATLATKNIKHIGIDVLICIGGDGTLRCVEFWNDTAPLSIPIICMALTIDQNLKLPGNAKCIGHHTFVDNLMESSLDLMADACVSGQDRVIICARQGSNTSYCLAKAIDGMATKNKSVGEDYPLSFIPSEFWPSENSVSLEEISQIVTGFSLKAKQGLVLLPEHLASKIKGKGHHLLRQTDGVSKMKFNKIPLGTVVMDGTIKHYTEILGDITFKDINPSIDYIFRSGVGTTLEIINAFILGDFATSIGILEKHKEPLVAFYTVSKRKETMSLKKLNSLGKRKLDLNGDMMKRVAKVCSPYLWGEEDESAFGLRLPFALKFGKRMSKIANG